MRVTEAEARTHWCPMVRHAADGAAAAVNRGDGGDLTVGLCIASYCMMWRWLEDAPKPRGPGMFWWDGEVENILGQPEPPRPDTVPADWVWQPVIQHTDDDWEGGYWEEPSDQVEAENLAAANERKGCCGLAWRPEQ